VRRTFYSGFGKRAADIGGALVGLFFLWPLLLLIALAITLDSPGPVLYRQERVGRDGRIFRMRKFRSMVMGAERMGTGVLVETRDVRVTRVGRFIRRLSIDELPQIFNVLGGDMSIVGPRPTLLYQVQQYDEHQRRRLRVRPGITGWAQVHGRNAIAWDERIRLDLEYVERLGPAIDILVLVRTIPVILQGRGLIARRQYWKP
jgi:lipopolysaccharide/colanic/teichoic acid biosynthesis glycosyltransferase